MNTIRKKFIVKLGLSFALLFSAANAFCNPQVSMRLKNISTSSNTIEYDLYVVNNSASTIQLAGFSFGVNFDETIVNGGEISYSLLRTADNKSRTFVPKMAVALTAVKGQSQARLTTGNTPFERAIELQANRPYKVGRFKIHNSNTWTPNSNPNFYLQESFAKGKTTCALMVLVAEGSETHILHVDNQMIETFAEKCPILNPSALQNARANNENSLLYNPYSVELYPNPVTDNLHVNYFAKASAVGTIQIIDMQGRLIQSSQISTVEGSNTILVDVHTLQKGMYIIKLDTGEKQASSHVFSKL
nr:T9SS type A sorting domain-containing protein [Chitinophagaceae bacterium]